MRDGFSEPVVRAKRTIKVKSKRLSHLVPDCHQPFKRYDFVKVERPLIERIARSLRHLKIVGKHWTALLMDDPGPKLAIVADAAHTDILMRVQSDRSKR